jgi:hypothetical protein
MVVLIDFLDAWHGDSVQEESYLHLQQESILPLLYQPSK